MLVEKNKFFCLICLFLICCYIKIMKRIIGEGLNSLYYEMIYVMFYEDVLGFFDKRIVYK